jgi:hypothetical protein
MSIKPTATPLIALCLGMKSRTPFPVRLVFPNPMKIHSLLAGTLLLAAPVTALVSGCGGGGSGVTVPTPTSLPTTTPFPITTPLPVGPLKASFAVSTESTDGSNFGASPFQNDTAESSQNSESYTVTFIEGQQRTIQFNIADPATFTPDNLGKTYSLATSANSILATSTAQGATTPTSWGGTGYSQGSLRLIGFSGNRFTFELQNVVLSRRPSASGSNQGQSELKISGEFDVYIPAT